MQPELPFGAELRSILGTPREVRELSSSPGSRVWRVRLSGNASRPEVVVKQVVNGSDARERFDREVHALRIAARAEPPVVPALLVTDPAQLVLVIEHLEHRRPPTNWAIGYATALARMHATALPSDAAVLSRWTGPTDVDVHAFVSLARALEISVTSVDTDELTELVHRFSSAPATALLHGDPCPGNDLYLDNSTVLGEATSVLARKGLPGKENPVRFVDFEQASLGNGLVELSYLRIGFPSCGYSVAPTDPEVEQAELAYRETWSATTGNSIEADFAAHIVDACAGWLIQGDALVQRSQRGMADRLALIPREDWVWGPMSARQRLVHRPGVVARLTNGRADLAGLHRISDGMRQRMLGRWPALSPLPARRVLL